jgi:hypothetical protein
MVLFQKKTSDSIVLKFWKCTEPLPYPTFFVLCNACHFSFDVVLHCCSGMLKKRSYLCQILISQELCHVKKVMFVSSLCCVNIYRKF